MHAPKGIPYRGSGAVFQIALDDILCKSFPIPDHWAQICAIDLGWAIRAQVCG